MSKAVTIASGILTYLDSQKALDLLPEIIAELKLHVNQSPKVVVESAIDLSPDQKFEIISSLSQNYSVSSNVEFSINPSLIGGLKINIGDQVLDASVKARVEDIYAR